jgi:hypothetical protein
MDLGVSGTGSDRGQGAALRAVLWYALALATCLSVLAINGRPLFYWDTLGYVDQGLDALAQVGLADPVPAPDAGTDAVDATTTGTEPAATVTARPTVDGSRSIVYSLVLGVFAKFGVLDLVDLFHALAVIVAIWLPVRIARRLYAPDQPLAFLVVVPVLVSCLGSLPFIVSYLMPDIFAPIMLLTIATLTAFAQEMRPWETVLALVMGAFALVAHLSHLAIGAVLIPAAFLVAMVFIGRRGWVAPILVALIVLAGIGQQAVFRAAATKLADSEVIIKPFITARLIQDGVGYEVLAEVCPDPSIQTCKLYAQLEKSSDPWRLTASHIIFEKDAELGSLRLLPEEDQRLVARDQIPFFLTVLKTRPLATTLAFARNTVIQAGMFSVDMTIPTSKIIAQHEGVPGMIGGAFLGGRLSPDGVWLQVLTVMQGVLYAGSLLLIAVMLVQRDRIPAPLRGFAVMLLLGVLANAFVCGGISQPASRYGMRVIWLLPLAATILLLFARYGQTRTVR